MNVFEKDGPIKCDECSSTFATTGGLAIHKGWKHRSPEKTAKAALHELTKKKEPKKKAPQVIPNVEIVLEMETVRALCVYALEDLATKLKKGKG